MAGQELFCPYSAHWQVHRATCPAQRLDDQSTTLNETTPTNNINQTRSSEYPALPSRTGRVQPAWPFRANRWQNFWHRCKQGTR